MGMGCTTRRAAFRFDDAYERAAVTRLMAYMGAVGRPGISALLL